MATPEEISAAKAVVKQLNDMIASGARSVMIGGQQVTYNTTTSLIAARDDAVTQLNALTGGGRRKQHYAAQVTRGYD